MFVLISTILYTYFVGKVNESKDRNIALFVANYYNSYRYERTPNETLLPVLVQLPDPSKYKNQLSFESFQSLRFIYLACFFSSIQKKEKNKVR